MEAVEDLFWAGGNARRWYESGVEVTVCEPDTHTFVPAELDDQQSPRVCAKCGQPA